MVASCYIRSYMHKNNQASSSYSSSVDFEYKDSRKFCADNVYENLSRFGSTSGNTDPLLLDETNEIAN